MSVDDGDGPEDGDGDGPEDEGRFIRDGDFQSGFGQELSAALDMVTWETGHDFEQLFELFKTQVANSVSKEESLRAVMRKKLFPHIKLAKLAPASAGVYPTTLERLNTSREKLLYQGQAEAVISTVV